MYTSDAIENYAGNWKTTLLYCCNNIYLLYFCRQKKWNLSLSAI